MKRYIFKNRKLSIMLIVANMLVAIIGIIMAFIYQYVGDVVGNQQVDSIGKCILLILFFIVFYYFTAYAFRKAKNAYRENLATQIKNDLFKGIFQKNQVEFNQENTSKYSSIFNNDIRLIEDQYFLSFFDLFSNIFELVLGIGYALFINLWIGLIMLTIGFVSVFLPKLISFQLSEVNAAALEEQGEYNIFLKDSFSGFDVIKSTLSRERFFKQHSIHNDLMEEKRKEMNYKNARVANLTRLIVISCQLFLAMVFACFVLYGHIDLPMMFALIQLETSVFYPLESALNDITKIKASKDVCNKIANLIDTKENKIKESTIYFNDHIMIENLSFRYPSSETENEKVLNNINYCFEKNKKYAIVGSSGCGKSTLVKLLLMQYRDYEGRISLDSFDYQALNENDIYKIMAVIPQNIFIFNDTLRNNITLYQEATDEEIMECANKAGLTPVIEAQPSGLNTLIDENGNNFSGGEKQRIAIARAYLNKSKFILLDEATGSLDNQTAYLVEKAILDDSSLTCISITHRYNEENLNRYDEIIVMNEGIIEEKGNFRDLMKKKSLFYELYSINQKEASENLNDKEMERIL